MRKSWTDNAWDSKFDSAVKNKKTLRWNYRDNQNTERETSHSGTRKFNIIKCGKGFGRRYDDKDTIEYDYDDRGDLIVKNRENSDYRS